jgi:hypothetical protein
LILLAVPDQGEKSSSPRAGPWTHRLSILRIDREGKRGRNLFFQLHRNRGVTESAEKTACAHMASARSLVFQMLAARTSASR